MTTTAIGSDNATAKAPAGQVAEDRSDLRGRPHSHRRG
jgi:hypothetical protein